MGHPLVRNLQRRRVDGDDCTHCFEHYKLLKLSLFQCVIYINICLSYVVSSSLVGLLLLTLNKGKKEFAILAKAARIFQSMGLSVYQINSHEQ